MRQYALRTALLDQPNARSSHTQPTPRGGGIAIVLAVLLALLIGSFLLPVLALPQALVGASALVALVGFFDDHKPLPASTRLLVQGLAAAWLVWSVSGLAPVPVFGHSLQLGLGGYVFAWLFLVWFLNLFNFMDGIDGIAGSQAVTVFLAAALCHMLAGPAPAVGLAALLAAVACFGFLLWNWPPARIFMGDAGSGFLGFFIAALALQAAAGAGRLFWCWVLLMGVFVVDATLTLLRRLLRGERVFDAHRCHAYQHASRRYGSHRAVTLAIIAINVFWLTPLAVLVALSRLDGLVATIIAYLPLLGLALFYQAGVQEGTTALYPRD